MYKTLTPYLQHAPLTLPTPPSESPLRTLTRYHCALYIMNCVLFIVRCALCTKEKEGGYFVEDAKEAFMTTNIMHRYQPGQSIRIGDIVSVSAFGKSGYPD